MDVYLEKQRAERILDFIFGFFSGVMLGLIGLGPFLLGIARTWST